MILGLLLGSYLFRHASTNLRMFLRSLACFQKPSYALSIYNIVPGSSPLFYDPWHAFRILPNSACFYESSHAFTILTCFQEPAYASRIFTIVPGSSPRFYSLACFQDPAYLSMLPRFFACFQVFDMLSGAWLCC
jgi:hypothetical protein